MSNNSYLKSVTSDGLASDYIKDLILQKLGKRKVRSIIKSFMIQCFNDNIEYNAPHYPVFTFPENQTIQGFGLPELGDDWDWFVGDLVEFVGHRL